MSVRNSLVLLLALSTVAFLIACGGGSSKTNPVAPPSGGISDSNLNGTYVFSVAGTDATGAPYAMVGTLTANSSGGITAGTFDINDANTTEFPNGSLANQAISSGSTYHVSVDGRGQATLKTSISGFTPVLDFVLSSNSAGQVTEFDSFATGSGTLDLQAANTTPTGSYAFSLSGASASGASATVGNFTLAGTTLTGADDLNEASLLNYAGSTLTGSLALGPSSTPATTLTVVNAGNTVFSGTFDVFSIDATHLKFIEMDSTATLSGDAYSQTSTTFPTGTLAFTLEGLTASSVPVAAGGFMSASGGTISGTEDYNVAGSQVSSQSAPAAFSGVTYTVDPTDAGRYTIAIPTGVFIEGTTYVAYPSSGGTLLLEMDTAGVTAGAAFAQTSGATFAATAKGYGLNLTGANTSSGQAVEVDDIAEFAANPTGTTVTGLIDENYFDAAASGGLFFDQILSGTYGSIDSTGRYGLAANTGTSSTPGTLEGGFTLTLYAVDGTNFPFVELDSGQVSAGMIVLQSVSSSSAVAKTHMFVTHPMFNPHAARGKKQ
jgi:hypothetical protein